MSDKVRIRFRKTGDLRFLGHHDLIRTFERMMRRAGLPFRSSEGFHPKPKMAFASALGLGIVGHQEVLEVELEVELPLEAIRERLAAEAPVGLEIIAVRRIDRRTIGQPCRATYWLPLEAETSPELPQRVAAFLGQSECWVERTRPQIRKINIRPYVAALQPESHGLTMVLHITPQGAARPEEVLQALGLAETLMKGAVLERTALQLEDETDPSEIQRPSSVAEAKCT